MEHTAQLPKMRFVHTAIFVGNATGQRIRKKKRMTNSSKAQLVERYFFSRRQVCVFYVIFSTNAGLDGRTQEGKILLYHTMPHMMGGIINSLHWPNNFRSAGSPHLTSEMGQL